jgi:hypothetical protein
LHELRGDDLEVDGILFKSNGNFKASTDAFG